MKKIILSLAVLMLVATGFSTTPLPHPAVPEEINVKVLDAFNKTFVNTENLKWYENENNFEARFSLDGVRSIVWYNKKGELLKMHRYYFEYKLPPFLLGNIRKKMPDQKIYGVTEITNSAGVAYYITIEDKKNWVQLKADNTGEFEIIEKFKKA